MKNINSVSAVPLVPFGHQVGGHASLLRLSKTTVCKPITSKTEQEFYENIEKAVPFQLI